MCAVGTVATTVGPYVGHVIDARSKQSTNMFTMAAIMQPLSSKRFDSSAISAEVVPTIAVSKGVSVITLLSNIASSNQRRGSYPQASELLRNGVDNGTTIQAEIFLDNL